MNLNFGHNVVIAAKPAPLAIAWYGRMIDAPHTGAVVRYDATAGFGTIMGYGRLASSGPVTPGGGGFAQAWILGVAS